MAKILIVEDDNLIRNLYKRALEKDNHEVVEAVDGNDGFNKMHEGGYDLVLLDVMLPGMNGMDILKELRDKSHPLNPNKKVVILTNLDEETVKSDSDYFGAAGYIIKSQFDVTKMGEEIKKYL